MNNEWIWIGVNFDFNKFTTYSTTPYKEHPINPLFENIKNISDIQSNISHLRELIKSVTSCYFDFNDDIFYRDQQDCVIWAHDSKTGGVYIYDNNDKNIKTYVAKSIPEFLSHIYDDNNNYSNKSLEYVRSLRSTRTREKPRSRSPPPMRCKNKNN